MKFFVTGVGGQLGHDVMNELLKHGHEGVGSDIQENYSGVADDSAITKAPYVALDITCLLYTSQGKIKSPQYLNVLNHDIKRKETCDN